MFKAGQIRKFLFLSLGFGLIMGLVFPIFASFFTEYKNKECQIIFIISCIIAGITVGLVSYLIANITIIKSIKMLYKHFDNISDGDLNGRIYIKGEDDISKLTKDFNSMSESLRLIINSINNESVNIEKDCDVTKNKIEDLNSLIGFITAAIQTLSASVQETSAATTEMKSTSSKIQDSLNAISDNSANGVKIVSEISNRANQLKRMAFSSKENAEKIHEVTKAKLLDSINKSKSIEKISELTQLILQISQQSNLLALNASIESARSGESRNGFSVVANEIRKLAEDSQSTVLKIQAISENIVNVVNELVSGAKEVLDFINNQVIKDYDMFVNVGEKYHYDAEVVNKIIIDFNSEFSKILEFTELAVESVSEISKANEQNADSSYQISEKMITIAEDSNAVNNMINEAKNSSEKLVNLVSKFRV
jgi:methyl-accepting chemotaxis protein